LGESLQLDEGLGLLLAFGFDLGGESLIFSIFLNTLSIALVSFGLTLINYGIDEVSNPRLQSERILKSKINGSYDRNGSTPVEKSLYGK